MKWLDEQVSLYRNHTDITGRPYTFRQIFYQEFRHDFRKIFFLRKLNPSDPNYKDEIRNYKSQLQCYAPSALLKSRAKDEKEIISLTGIVQLDFDHEQIKQYDIEELRRMFFSLPFVGYSGISCSGKGIYTLIQIAQPERQGEYVEVLQGFFEDHGICPDKTKGKNCIDLRYLSFDTVPLIREDPEAIQLPPGILKKKIHQG